MNGLRIDSILDEVNDVLDQQHDVATFSMGDLKKWGRVERLGGDIRRRIEEALEMQHIGAFPWPLPARDRAFVRLYRKNRPVGKLIDAIVAIGIDETLHREPDELENQDEVIRHFMTGNTSIERDAIEKIRRILDGLK